MILILILILFFHIFDFDFFPFLSIPKIIACIGLIKLRH